MKQMSEILEVQLHWKNNWKKYKIVIIKVHIEWLWMYTQLCMNVWLFSCMIKLFDGFNCMHDIKFELKPESLIIILSIKERWTTSEINQITTIKTRRLPKA